MLPSAPPPAPSASRRRATPSTPLGLPPGRIAFLGLPDTASPMHGPAFDAAVDTIASLLAHYALTEILATWQHDPHCDHLSAHHLARRRRSPAPARGTAPTRSGAGPSRPTPRFPPPPPAAASTSPPTSRPSAAPSPPTAPSTPASSTTTPPASQLPPDFLRLFDGPYETLLDV